MMPQACTRKGRVIQVTKWLRENFPTAYPVKVQIFDRLPFIKSEYLSKLSAPDRKRGYYGWCTKKKSWFLIALSDSALKTMADMTETLIHEWAHAVSEKFSKLEEHRVSSHDDEFFLTWGRIYRAWEEQGGAEDANKYKF